MQLHLSARECIVADVVYVVDEKTAESGRLL